MHDGVIVIDRFNQVHNLPRLSYFKNKIATIVVRSDEYILSTSLHPIGCYRGACKGTMGIQKIRYSDPLEYRRMKSDRKSIFARLANQVPHTSFIEVDRGERGRFVSKRRKKMFYTVVKLHYSPGTIRITGNPTYSKEIDDMLTVALFLELKKMGREAYIQSCDKYRWMEDVGMSDEQKRQVQENQLIPYFLSKEMMSDPALLLMGYECSYDCSQNQRNPHDETCMLKTPFEEPVYE